jgi:N-methylhydantoinase A
MQKLADQMHLSLDAAAHGIIDVANVNIDRALRRVSIARGHDPRQFTLVAFGGAGPLHACAVAERLEIPRVLVPRYPGVLCAFGLLVADVVVDYSRPVMHAFDVGTIARLRAMQGELLAQARADLAREGIPEDKMAFDGQLDMRYKGQAYELTVPFRKNVLAAFHKAHEYAYGHAMPNREVEIVNLRLKGVGMVDKPVLEPEAIAESDGAAACLGEKTLLMGEVVSLYERELLSPGAHFKGPSLIFQLDSTVYVPEGWTVAVDGYRNLVIEQR